MRIVITEIKSGTEHVVLSQEEYYSHLSKLERSGVDLKTQIRINQTD